MINFTGCRRIPAMLFTLILGLTVWVRFVAAVEGNSTQSGLPADAVLVDKLGSDGVTVYRRERTLWLVLNPKVVKRESSAVAVCEVDPEGYEAVIVSDSAVSVVCRSSSSN